MARWTATVLLVAGMLISPPLGAQVPEQLVQITGADLLEHLDVLQAIADANGGNRAYGTSGYAASVDYVTGRLEAAGYVVDHEPVLVVDPSGETDEVALTTNVIAERPGVTDEVVMVGAHLDSVPDGPGINDDGSGVAGVLEIAEQLASTDVVTRRSVRFAFWGAEEAGLVGSLGYVESRSSVQLDRIVAYLNADMIGSRNYVRGVYDPDIEIGDEEALGAIAAPGSEAISDRLYAYFDSVGLPTVPIATDGGSDDASFAAAGVATGGVFTGAAQRKTRGEAALFGGTAGKPTDPCYHQPCDGLDNVDLEVASQLAQGLGAVALELAGIAAPDAVAMAPVAIAVGLEPSYVG
jgi:aminopeptidase S